MNSWTGEFNLNSHAGRIKVSPYFTVYDSDKPPYEIPGGEVKARWMGKHGFLEGWVEGKLKKVGNGYYFYPVEIDVEKVSSLWKLGLIKHPLQDIIDIKECQNCGVASDKLIWRTYWEEEFIARTQRHCVICDICSFNIAEEKCRKI